MPPSYAAEEFQVKHNERLLGEDDGEQQVRDDELPVGDGVAAAQTCDYGGTQVPLPAAGVVARAGDVVGDASSYFARASFVAGVVAPPIAFVVVVVDDVARWRRDSD